MAEHVERGVNTAMWRYRATVRLHAPAERIRGLPLGVDVEPETDTTCLLHSGGDDLNGMAVWIGFLGVDFEVLDCPELVEVIRELSERYRRAAAHRPGVTSPDS